jgi:uncharacterized Fe-S cluster protein YjdI
MKESTLKYTNGEVTVLWKPSFCAHSTLCFRGLREVFDPTKRPWINMGGASTERIIEQVQKCPSGALTYTMNVHGVVHERAAATSMLVEPAPNGPLLVHGEVTIRDSHGNETQRSNVTAFCRCGHSRNKPLCDGSHVRVGFRG